jgi:release factor glutamine methyltransferase
VIAGTETVGSIVAAAADRLAAAGIDDAGREAAVLMARRLGCPPALVILRRQDALDRAVAELFLNDVSRRERREPEALIRGERSFFGREFAVSPATLVPRPETELLVEAVLSGLKDGMRVLDIGTGSGCIAVTVAAERPGARVTAVDVSEDALAVARRNAEKHAFSNQIEFLRSDLYAAFGPAAGGDFDIIVSNPPYVSTQVIPTLEPELQFEPRIALDGGDDGLDVIRPLIARSAAFLRPGGRLFLEIGFDQAERVASLMSSARYTSVVVGKDHAGHDRILSGVMSGPI